MKKRCHNALSARPVNRQQAAANELRCALNESSNTVGKTVRRGRGVGVAWHAVGRGIGRARAAGNWVQFGGHNTGHNAGPTPSQHQSSPTTTWS